ncbi:MAG TPA: hypothetical protein PLT66_01785 [Bacillota bacterium]|nr:hypothetical protein [Bacillota bacterium]
MTAQDILDMSLDIMSERRSDGTRPADLGYFTSRAVAYINITLAECAPYEAQLSGREIDFLPVTALSDEIHSDIQIAYTAMPYCVASLYMLAEDDDRYKLFRTLFENALLKATRERRGRVRSITDVYT